ncbi:MAG: hypothetical protein IPK00_24175 [Deltaproteobacteria bacterium]|nr:hypothetical protein [Deltaproteobacteria bacterium]
MSGLPALLAAVIEIGVFVVKLALVLALVAQAARATPALRDDQWIRIVTRRMLRSPSRTRCSSRPSPCSPKRREEAA